MLLALAALAIAVPAGALALRGAASRAVESSTRLDEERARLAALSLGPALLRWASEQEGSGASAPVGADGSVRILEQPATGAEGSRVVVDAIDLSGRLHIDALGTLGRNGLPPPLDQLSPAPALGPAPSPAPGITSMLPDRGEGDAPLYPEAMAWWALDRAGAVVSSFPTRSDAEERDLAPSVVHWLAGPGHGAAADRRRRAAQPARPTALNIRTAPIELLRAALVGYDPALARTAMACRERGEPIPAEVVGSLVAASGRATPTGAMSVSGGGGGGWVRTPLTARSAAYGFIVSVERAGGRVSWWVVAERSPPGARRTDPALGGWTITERRRVYQ